MSNMPPNLYGIKPQDIIGGMRIWTDSNNGYGISEFQVLSRPIINNNILTIECVNIELQVNETIKINMHRGAEIFTSKLTSNWRKI